jgi:hypothetical protein
MMGEDAPVIQDLVEEVRRTIGMTRPALWLTYGIPESLATSLTPRLGATVRPMLAGDAIRLDDTKLSLAAIGICAKSYDPFPAFIDIKPAVDPESSGELLGSFKIMLVSALVLGVLAAAGTGVLFLISAIYDMQLKTKNEEIAKQTMDISQLTMEVQDLQKKASVDKELADKVNRIIRENASISKITDAIKNRIPSNLWLEKVGIHGNVEVEGKSMDYNSIISFSRNFDSNTTVGEGESPLRNMSLDNIEEVTEDNTKVYKFKMIGQPKI